MTTLGEQEGNPGESTASHDSEDVDRGGPTEKGDDDAAPPRRLSSRRSDALPADAARKSKAFYRDPAFIVAVLALLASLLATYSSYRTSAADQALKRDDGLLQQRIRLTTLVQNVASFGSSSADAQGTRQVGSPTATANRSQLTVDSIRPALDEASFLIGHLDNTPFQASSFEELEIAIGYNSANDPVTSSRFASHAEASAQNGFLADRVAAAKVLGWDYFESGQAERGRQTFMRGLQYVDGTETGFDRTILNRFRFELRSAWEYEELRAGNCVEATLQASAAAVLVGQFPKSESSDFANQAQQMPAGIAAACN